MRDGASGRSRGFGFLTFRDPRTVNVVMVKEHYLDGKIVRPSISTPTKTPSRFLNYRTDSSLSLLPIKIDPKRAIPRDEQERTSKIFVGGVSQDANEQDFKDYFTQFGRVVDATLMIDKDTGRPRGFGFVTFDSEAAVDATLMGDLQILGKPIEVKKAQPRGNMREEDEPANRRGGRRSGKENDRFRDNERGAFENNTNNGNNNNSNNQNTQQNQQGAQGMYGSGMTPQMMAQYWQKMQQYFATMQQQMATAAAVQNGGMAGQMGMAGMNPAMLQQMQAMQQMKQMQAMQQQMARQQGSQSPLPQSPGAQGMQGMNPAMMQQMQQLQQMQMQQAQAAGGFGGGAMAGAAQTNAPVGPAMGNYGGRRGTPGYNAQDQLLFEQQKYEQQQARRAAQEVQQLQTYQQGGPTSWEGMYDDVPQPNLGGPQGGVGRGGGQAANGNSKGSQPPNRGSQGPQSAPPANAPTGPKNAGKPGANYRGGGRGAHRGFHPYARG